MLSESDEWFEGLRTKARSVLKPHGPNVFLFSQSFFIINVLD
jgi:hypothetical protein